MRRYTAIVVKLAVSVGLLWLLFSRVDAEKLWESARRASPAWLAAGFGFYALNVAASVWRWHLLLDAQHVHVRRRLLIDSYLVALFFNNFLPSSIGGDVIRIRDSARPARSRTLATTVVLADRAIGLVALVLVAATGATVAVERASRGTPRVWASWLWVGFFAVTVVSAPAVLVPSGIARLLRPLTVFHREWVTDRIEMLTVVLSRFRERLTTLASCFGAAVVVQAMVVLFYVAVAHGLHVGIAAWDLAVLVPMSAVVQMVPVSVNGFGVREATFTFYFHRLGLPIESAVLLSLVGAGLIMLFSVSGAAVYVARGH